MEGGEWQPLFQSVFLGLVFSYFLAKLISAVLSIKDETRGDVTRPDPAHQDDDSAVAEQSNVESFYDDEDDEDDDDWERVESTELDELFSAATAFVAAAERRKKLSTEKKLQLYGLYKIATEGPCTAPQPSAIKMTARAKWKAWKKLGAMPTEEAMEKYLDIVLELYPTWADGLVVKSKGGNGSSDGNDSKESMRPVLNMFVERYENDFKMHAIHIFAREGEMDNLLKCIDSGVSVNAKDSEGRTPLHWAVDRGHLNLAVMLVSRNADVNAKDNEGLTALHYAAVCDREGIAEYLVKNNADTNVKDNGGNSPSDLCESNWSWLQHAKD